MVVDAAYAVSGNANVLLIGGYLGTAAAGIFQAPARLLILSQYPGLSVANAVATHANTVALSHRFQLLEGGTR